MPWCQRQKKRNRPEDGRDAIDFSRSQSVDTPVSANQQRILDQFGESDDDVEVHADYIICLGMDVDTIKIRVIKKFAIKWIFIVFSENLNIEDFKLQTALEEKRLYSLQHNQDKRMKQTLNILDNLCFDKETNIGRWKRRSYSRTTKSHTTYI